MEARPSDPAPGDAWTPEKQICPMIRPGQFSNAAGISPSARTSEPCPLEERPLAHVRGILFEPANIFYDDTLWRRWLLKVLTKMGLHTHYHVFFAVWQSEYVPQVHRGEKCFPTALREFLAASGFVSRQIEELIAATKAQRTKFEAEHRLLPGVARSLNALHRTGKTLAVSADSAFGAADIADKLDRLGLQGLFRGVISSRELRASKPSDECYQAAVDLLGVESSETAFVSCHAAHLTGASEFGMTPIANRCTLADENYYSVERFEHLLDLFPAECPKRLAG